MRTNLKPRIQFCRKLGHLWQTCYGVTGKANFYGYGVTRGEASQEARSRYGRKAARLNARTEGGEK